MTRDNVFRLAFYLLMLATILVFGRSAFAQAKDITLDIAPRAVVANPYKRTTFRVILRIFEHPDNRLWSYSATCGVEIRSSIRSVDRITNEWFEELTVVEPCYFQACVHRNVDGKVKNFCAHQEVLVPEGG